MVFVDFSARLKAMTKQLGMYKNIRQATTHKPVEMVLNFDSFLFPGDTACSLCTFLASLNNLKLTNINGGRNTAMNIVKDTGPETIKPYLGIMCMTVVVISNTARKDSSLRLVTDVR